MIASSPSAGVSLRPFPWPWDAALAICNDIDDASPALFTAVHRLLNGREETPHGVGLGLEVADSLWLWSNDTEVLGLLDERDRPTFAAKRLAELAAEGWIDSLHALGDFNQVGEFTRARAAFAYKTLEEMGIRLGVWINHGNHRNRQNFRCRLNSDTAGDAPGAPEYHADHALAYGIRYSWWHEVVPHPLSCASPPIIYMTRLRLETAVKNAAKNFLGRGATARPADMLFQLALPTALRDDSMLWSFTRYNRHPEGAWGRPGRHSFRHQLTPAFLTRLRRCGGYAILYTHFGQPRRPGVPLPDPLFEPPDYMALARLAREHHEGRILVAGTRRLLDWWLLRQHLDWHAETLPDGRTRINIAGLADPIAGYQVPALEDLAGLAFTCSDPSTTIVTLADRPAEGFIPFPGGIHLPWKPLSVPAHGFYLGN